MEDQASNNRYKTLKNHPKKQQKATNMEGLEATLTTVFTIARVSIYTALAAGLALTVFVLLNGLISYSKLGYYKKQGIKTYYFPVIGLLKLAKPLFFKKNKEESQVSESEDLIAGNHFMSTEPLSSLPARNCYPNSSFKKPSTSPGPPL